MLYQSTGRKSRSPQRQQVHQEIPPNRTLIPNPPRSSGVTIVGPTTVIATHTHTLAEPLCPRRSRHHWHLLCPRARHRDGVDMPDAGLHPHREAMHKRHTEPGPSCCVPFGDPHVHKVAIGRHQAGCSHSSTNTLGPIHHVARTHQADDKSKGREKKGVHQQRVLC